MSVVKSTSQFIGNVSSEFHFNAIGPRRIRTNTENRTYHYISHMQLCSNLKIVQTNPWVPELSLVDIARSAPRLQVPATRNYRFQGRNPSIYVVLDKKETHRKWDYY